MEGNRNLDASSVHPQSGTVGGRSYASAFEPLAEYLRPILGADRQRKSRHAP